MDTQTPAAVSMKDIDPTILTTQQLWREIASLKELLINRIVAVERLNEEKFSGVQKQFGERDVRFDQSAIQVNTAVYNAMQSAEKAVNKQNESFAQSIAKSEAATMKQIDQQVLSNANSARTLDDKLNDLKDRITRIEGMGSGKKDFWGYIVGLVGLIATIIGIASYLFSLKK